MRELLTSAAVTATAAIIIATPTITSTHATIDSPITAICHASRKFRRFASANQHQHTSMLMRTICIHRDLDHRHRDRSRDLHPPASHFWIERDPVEDTTLARKQQFHWDRQQQYTRMKLSFSPQNPRRPVPPPELGLLCPTRAWRSEGVPVPNRCHLFDQPKRRTCRLARHEHRKKNGNYFYHPSFFSFFSFFFLLLLS